MIDKYFTFHGVQAQNYHIYTPNKNKCFALVWGCQPWIVEFPWANSAYTCDFEHGESGKLVMEFWITPFDYAPYDGPKRAVASQLEENRIIEIAPLAYMRGRTLSECFVILDEAQNTTKEQMKMFLTRLGEGTQAVVTGDITQIDLTKRSSSGLLDVISVLKSIREIEFTFLGEEDVVRNPLVRKIVRAYEANQEE